MVFIIDIRVKVNVGPSFEYAKIIFEEVANQTYLTSLEQFW